ncbi:MAG: hypothetical protein ACHQX1_02030, partial [Candidatus Micrarchaeales archaeon]
MTKGKGRKNTKRAQSAIEYLVTYGWVFLVIGLVIGALFYLGIFSQNTYAVRAQPGSCSISRPNGPFTTQLISVAGTCTNLPPSYMPFFSSLTTQQAIFNYQYLAGNNFTITSWVYWAPGTVFSGSTYGFLWGGGTGAGTDNQIAIWNNNGNFEVDYSAADTHKCSTSTAKYGTWYLVGLTWNNATKTSQLYVNGTAQCTFSTVSNIIITGSIYIGGSSGTWKASSNGAMNGYVSNVQFYNTIMSQSGMQALYYEGVGGVPIMLNNLIGWFPLNGN